MKNKQARSRTEDAANKSQANDSKKIRKYLR